MPEQVADVIVVSRICDLPVPFVKSKKVRCSSCQLECWVDVRMPSALKAVCIHCIQGVGG